jgi:hypothetical protein
MRLETQLGGILSFKVTGKPFPFLWLNNFLSSSHRIDRFLIEMLQKFTPVHKIDRRKGFRLSLLRYGLNEQRQVHSANNGYGLFWQ